MPLNLAVGIQTPFAISQMSFAQMASVIKSYKLHSAMSDRGFAFFTHDDMAHDVKTSLVRQKLPLFKLSLTA